MGFLNKKNEIEVDLGSHAIFVRTTVFFIIMWIFFNRFDISASLGSFGPVVEWIILIGLLMSFNAIILIEIIDFFVDMKFTFK